jgi:hypothetical protein
MIAARLETRRELPQENLLERSVTNLPVGFRRLPTLDNQDSSISVKDYGLEQQHRDGEKYASVSAFQNGIYKQGFETEGMRNLRLDADSRATAANAVVRSGLYAGSSAGYSSK